MTRLAAMISVSLALTLGLSTAHAGRLDSFSDYGDNPGNLKARVYVPENVQDGAALVVALHGCTQSASDYDNETGWTDAADRYNAVILLPEQKEMNHPWICFNWMEPKDSSRDKGEAASIANMTRTAIERFNIDPGKVYVTGLSAGAAMTNVMMATYPDIFTGGAPVAGPPYRCATNQEESYDCLSRKIKDPAEWGDLVRSASSHNGAWPKVSIWHGERDRTVRVKMMQEEIKQWTNVHGVPEKPTRTEKVGKHVRQVWEKDGVAVIEAWTLDRMRHGAPVNPGKGEDNCGRKGQYTLNAGICGPMQKLKFWGATAQSEGGSKPSGNEVADASSASNKGNGQKGQSTRRSLVYY